MNRLSLDEYRQILGVEVGRLTAVTPAQLELLIPHISGWTVRSVITHAAQVLWYADQAVVAGPEAPPSKVDVGTPPEDNDLVPWLVDASSTVAATLRGIDPERLFPTWAGPRPASWYFRRLCHEMSVHRWDAQAAWMAPEAIDRFAAVDALDEMLEVHMPHHLDFDALAGSGETVHLHTTDGTDGEWFLEYQSSSVRWEHSHRKGDVAVRGSASDLLLMMWGRLKPSELEVFGDISLVERWQMAAKF